MRPADPQLVELFDVELQLLRDRDAARDDLRRRDRRIGLAIGAGRPDADRRAVVRDWIREVQRDEGRESAGERVVRAYHGLGWLLVVLGLASGAGAARAVLAYDGRHPVNVVHFLAVFVAAQLLLLLLLLSSALLWRLRGRLPGLGAAYGLLKLGLDAVLRLFERRLSAERRAALAAARGRLRSSSIIYGDLERWLLLTLAQRFGLWFNLGALATCLYLVAFSDLAFAWQTTLRVSAEGFHRIVAVLAAPWAWLYPDGLPSLEVVRASRYFRLEGSFGAAADGELLGQWWRFLVLCLVVYGLVPRLVTSLVARSRLRRALAGVRLDHAEIDALLERLASPVVSTRAPLPEGEPPATSAPGPLEAAVSPPGAAASVVGVVIWGDARVEPAEAAALIEGRFGWRVEATRAAGADDTRQDQEAIEAVAAGAAPVVVLVEAFEAPTRETRTFLERLRRALGRDRPVVVALVAGQAGRREAAGADDVRLWERQLARLSDPYLRVAALVEGP